jgi:hypothetical protein
MKKLTLAISGAVICGILYSVIGYFERGIYGMIADFLRGLFFSGIIIGLYLYKINLVSQIKLSYILKTMILVVPFLFASFVGITEYTKIKPLSDKVAETAAAFLLVTGILTFILILKEDRKFRDDIANQFIPPIVTILFIGLIVFLIWLFSNY